MSAASGAGRATAQGVSSASSASELVVGRLREEILDGSLPPGNPLREVALAERLDVSRNTLREAVQRLIAEGLVQREPHRGVSVAQHTAADVADLMAARLAIETGLPATNSHGIGPLLRLLDRLAEAVTTGDAVAATEADMAFHHALVSLRGSRRLSGFHTQLQNEMRVLLHAAERVRPEPDKANEHRALLDLARAGDAERFRRAASEHIERGRAALLASVRTE
ncbi:MAG: GntR family transcriptional regulator [Egibacteraceae bacterium]